MYFQAGRTNRERAPEIRVRSGSRTPLSALALGVAAKLLGNLFAEVLRDMEYAQWLSPEQLRTRTETRLAKLLRHAAENVPFYRDTYRRLGLSPSDLHTIQDLRALPIVTKSDYRKHAPEYFYALNVPAYRRMERSTSGSTGEPFRFCIDRRVLPVVFASHLFYDSWYGWRPFDRCVRIVSPPAAVQGLLPGSPIQFRLRQALTKRLQSAYELWTQRKIYIWEVDSQRAGDVWHRIESFRPDFILGYTSTLATIADELLSRDLRLTCRLRGVATIAETLSPTRRRLIEQYYQAPIINRFGLREFVSWSAQSCPESPDRFHINTELVVCEVVREDGCPAAPGETGHVVMTDLWNLARPFIRYDTGDLAVASSDPCTCGRGFPPLGPIEGRSHECLKTPSGKVISPAILGHHLFVYNGNLEVVRHYQLVQEARDRVRLLVVPASGWGEERRARLLRDLSALLGGEMQVTVQAVQEIPPEKSGKPLIIKLVALPKSTPV